MEYTTLGKTGLRISRLGFGGIPIQRIDEAGTKDLIHRAMEAGINYIDTARGYTVSEAYLGYALEGIRDRFILATKSMARTRDQMAADIDISLHNLRTDHIDLYQVHNPNMEQLEQVLAPGGALEALLEAKKAGKIRHVGLTAHSAAVFKRALELDWVETIMFPYNLVETQGEPLMQQCIERNVGFICMKPLAGGALDDASLALRFVCANDAVSVVIPGMAAGEELQQNLAAAADPRPLSEADWEKIRKIRRELGTEFCRRCNYCAPCTVGIQIPNVFLFEGYLMRYGLRDWAVTRYNGLKVSPEECIECGACESRCPYHLPIRSMLKRTAAEFRQAQA